MKNLIFQCITAGGLLLPAGVLPLAAQETAMDFELSRIDSGVASVSPFWGYNAAKLVFDGEHFYTMGRWGPHKDTGTGVVYRKGRDGWEEYVNLDGLHHQPGMLLLDAKQRMVIVHARIGAGPRIAHQRRRGSPRGFTEIALPGGLDRAGYIGAAMDGNRLILGYIGAPGQYSFNVAWVDLYTETWSGPFLLAREQRSKEPWTTWLYPLIVPEDDGFHLVVSNNAYRSPYYNRISYLFVRFDDPTSSVAEVVSEVFPWTGNLAFAQAIWRAADGTMFVTATHRPDGAKNQLLLYRRDPGTRRWEAETAGRAGIAAVFENPARPGQMWMSSTSGPALRLYLGEDGGRRWSAVALDNFKGYGLRNTFFLYGITPASGSLIPDEPCAVFSSGVNPNLELWFVRFHTSGWRTR